MDPKMNYLLQGKDVKLEELSLFMKLFDSLSEKNKDTFYAVADGMNYETSCEFINRTFNTHYTATLKELLDKRESIRNQELIRAFAQSSRSYDEILNYLNGTK